jgi:putative membrane protein
LLSSLLAVFVWSGIRPHDYYTWILEVGPATALILLGNMHDRTLKEEVN